MYDGAIGVKTGFTRAAGRCLVSAAERNGRTIIAVTLNDPNDWNDHMEMLDAGFAQYSEVTLHKAGDTIANARVFGGDTASVPLTAKNTVTAYLLPGEKEKLQRVRYGEKNLLCTGREDGTGGFGRISARDCVLGRDTLVYGGNRCFRRKKNPSLNALWNGLEIEN